MPVKFQGERMKARLRAVIAQGIDEDISARADRVVERAKADVPVASGALQQSIHKERAANPNYVSYKVIADAKAPGQSKSYAMAVEDGHIAANGRQVAAQPYMLPALQAAKG